MMPHGSRAVRRAADATRRTRFGVGYVAPRSGERGGVIGVRGRLATILVGALVAAALPTTASAGDRHSGGQSGSGACDVYPIAATASLLTPSRVGKVIDDLSAGTPAGHEGWL